MSTASTLTGLIPVIYAARDIVSREMVGAIPAVTIDASSQQAALNQTVRIPITPKSSSATSITPGLYAPDDGYQTISYVDMSISNSVYVPVRWQGEETQGFVQNGTYKEVLVNQLTQAMRTITNNVEAGILGLAINASRAYGSAAQTPFATSATAELAQIRKILNDNGAPLSDRTIVCDTSAIANMISLTHLTQQYAAGTDATLRQGTVLPLMGFDVKESAGVQSSTVSTASAYQSNGGNAIGDTSIVVGTGTGTVYAGDYVTFTGDPNKYLVTTGITAAGTLVIAAPGLKKTLVTTTAMQVASSAAVLNLAFHRGAIVLLARHPIMPLLYNGKAADMATDVMNIVDPVSGLNFQLAEYAQYRQVKYEIGLAYGYKIIKPEHTAVLLG